MHACTPLINVRADSWEMGGEGKSPLSPLAIGESRLSREKRWEIETRDHVARRGADTCQREEACGGENRQLIEAICSNAVTESQDKFPL